MRILQSQAELTLLLQESSDSAFDIAQEEMHSEFADRISPAPGEGCILVAAADPMTIVKTQRHYSRLIRTTNLMAHDMADTGSESPLEQYAQNLLFAPGQEE